MQLFKIEVGIYFYILYHTLQKSALQNHFRLATDIYIHMPLLRLRVFLHYIVRWKGTCFRNRAITMSGLK